nr:hypothetical protein [Zoogloeaceae bacterium]
MSSSQQDSINATEATMLRVAVSDMADLADSSLAKIIGITQLALVSLETPGPYRHPEMIAQALHAIWALAEQGAGCIRGEADSVGCLPDGDGAALRRCNARLAVCDLPQEIDKAQRGNQS